MSDLEFLDIALLRRIDHETTVEGFGSKISSTFFEAANLLGGLKIKGYIDIHSSIGNSPVILTDKGKMLIQEMELHSQTGLGRIDLAVLGNIRGGIKAPAQIEETLNVNSRDVAYSIYKLCKRGFVEYKVRNASVELALTTQGFEFEGGKQVQAEAPAYERREVPGFPDTRNRVAEELAKEEIAVGSGAFNEITLEQRLSANVDYYLKKYGAAVAAALAILAIAAALLLAAGVL